MECCLATNPYPTEKRVKFDISKSNIKITVIIPTLMKNVACFCYLLQWGYTLYQLFNLDQSECAILSYCLSVSRVYFLKRCVFYAR